jgi:hypothetical protein
MLYLLDLAGDVYSNVMAVINYICFTALCLCVVIIYIAGVIGQFQGNYKSMAGGSIIVLIILIVVHFVMLSNFGIPLLVPPINTPYFTDFMHVIQYLATFAVVILLAVILVMALLSRLDHSYGHAFTSALIFLIVILIIHFYIYNEFGIKIIFPPNLW